MISSTTSPAVCLLRRRLLAVAGLLLPLGLEAATWDVAPALGIGVAYDENAGVQTGGDRTSDVVGSVQASLTLTRRSARDLLALSYAPSYEAYRDESRLDQVEHRAGLHAEHRWSERTSFLAGYSFSRSARQGRIAVEDAGQAGPVVVPRAVGDDQNTVTRHRLEAGADLALGRRVAFLVQGSWSEERHSEPSAASDAGSVPGGRLSDSRVLGGRVGFSWVHSRRLSSRYFLAAGKVEENLEERDLQRLVAGLEAAAGRRAQVSAEVGVTRVEGDPSAPSSAERADDTRPTGRFTFRREFAPEESLSAGLVSDVGAASGTGSVAEILTFFVSYSRPLGRRWSGSLVVNETDREDLDGRRRLDRDTRAINALVELAVAQTLGVSAGIDWVDQDDPRGDLATRYAVYRLGLVWRPRVG